VIPTDFWESLELELIKTVLLLVPLALTWMFGNKIVAYWDIREKRRELDIAAEIEFHKLYGEFKKISRLWRVCMFKGARPAKFAFSPTAVFDLLKRASAAEARVEAIIVKLATERVLEEPDIRTLGLFRQAYQQLREAIRDAQDLHWTNGTPEYDLFNELTVRTACIIASNKTTKQDDPVDAARVLKKITSVRPEHWQSEIERIVQPALCASAVPGLR
jgi:hypothetical protein